MRINSADGIALARRLYRKYGSWRAVRAAIAGEARSGETVKQGSTGTASTRAEGIAPTSQRTNL